MNTPSPLPPEHHIYEYAVIRYVPDIEREEFINVGLMMMCKRRRWIAAEIHLDPTRLSLLPAPHTPADIERQLRTFTAIARGLPEGGPMAALPVEERFRWLTAVKSSCLQTSRPHPGLTPDLPATFATLLHRLVK